MGVRFEHEALPGRVVFGAGRVAAAPAEAARLGGRRVVLVASPRDAALVERVGQALGGRVAGRIDGIRQHVPEAVAEAARERFATARGDLLLAIGGGSAIGVAKAVALTAGAPILAVPTTYAGSEMTPIWGVTAGGRKTTGRDLRVLPRAVIYDPELTLTLPPALSAASALNALAHCAEALWSPAGDPAAGALAEEGVRALAAGLPRVVRAPDDLDARADLLLGAWLAGKAMAVAGTGLHHRLAHVLGGAFGLPHADVHAALLPYTTAYAVAGRPQVAERLARGLGARDAAGGVWDLARAAGAPTGQAALPLSTDQVDEAARLAADGGRVRAGDLRELLLRARAGARPGDGA
jgi:alcohol dehydrogenase class IV